MSNTSKTYTAEQVEQMIAEALAKKSAKKVEFAANSGEFVTRKGEKRAFSNIKITGDFYPTSLSYAAAQAVLDNLEAFKAVVAAKPKVEAKSALTSGEQAPRLAP